MTNKKCFWITEPDIVTLEPGGFDKLTVDKVYKLILHGNQVQSEGLMSRILNADKVMSYNIKGEPISVVAIKNPCNDYRLFNFKTAGIEDVAEMYLKELGWIYTFPVFRQMGLCKVIFNKIINECKNNLYAITNINNFIMINMLSQSGFSQIGNDYSNGRSMFRIYIKDFIQG